MAWFKLVIKFTERKTCESGGCNAAVVTSAATHTQAHKGCVRFLRNVFFVDADRLIERSRAIISQIDYSLILNEY